MTDTGIILLRNELLLLRKVCYKYKTEGILRLLPHNSKLENAVECFQTSGVPDAIRHLL